MLLLEIFVGRSEGRYMFFYGVGTLYLGDVGLLESLEVAVKLLVLRGEWTGRLKRM